MAQTIKLKRSATTGNAPTTSQLALGELGINTTDGKLFLKKSVSGTESIVEVGGLPLSGGTLTGNLSLGDNVKLQLGNQTNGDLQIYHSGSHSFISEQGTGDLYIGASNNIALMNAAFSENKLLATTDGALKLYYNGSEKLATTSTGIDVTGSVTADGLTVNSGTTNTVATFTSTDSGAGVTLTDNTGSSNFQTTDANLRIGVDDDNAVANSAIQFRVDGSTKATITDASTRIHNSLMVGSTTAPNTTLHLSGLTGSPPKLTLEEGGAESRIYATKNSPTNSDLRFQTEISGTIADRMLIDYSGNASFSGAVTSTVASANPKLKAAYNSSNYIGISHEKINVQGGGVGLIIQGNGVDRATFASGGGLTLANGDLTLTSGSVTSTGLTVDTSAGQLDVEALGGSSVKVKSSGSLKLQGTGGSVDLINGSTEVLSTTTTGVSINGRLNIPNDGLMIGATTAPSSYYAFANNLVVTGDSANRAGMTISGTATSMINLSDGTGLVGFIDYNHSNDSMTLGTAASNALVIDSSQNATFSSSVTAGAISGTSLSIDTLSMNGSSIGSSGNMTLDSANSIILDADGGDVMLKDNTVWFGNFNHNGSNLRIDAKETNGNIHLNPDGTGSVNVLSSLMVGSTTAPSSRLHIKAADNNYTGGILIEDTDSLTKSGITHVNGGLYLSSNATNDHLEINSLGDATFSNTLEVNNHRYFDSDYNVTYYRKANHTILGYQLHRDNGKSYYEWNTGGTHSYDFQFVSNNSPVLSLATNGNVNIPNGSLMVGATTAPSGLVHVASSKGSGGDLWTQVGAGNTSAIHIQNTANAANTNAVLYFRNSVGEKASVGARFVNQSTGETELRFSTTNSSGTSRERVTIGGDGSVGIGVVPSANSSYMVALQLGEQANLYAHTDGVGAGSATYLSNNITHNSGFKYINADAGSQYTQASGAHKWSSFASGSAGGAATENTRMTLTSGGDLLVGTTSVSTATQGIKLRSDLDAIAAVADGQISGYFGRLNSDGGILNFRKDSTTIGSIGTTGGDLLIHSSASSHVGLRFGEGYIFPTDNSGATANGTVDLGILGASAFKDLYLSGNATAQKLTLTKDPVGTYTIEVDGTNTGQPNLIVKQSTSERFRCDNNGNLLVGTTSTTPAFGTGTGINISPTGESMISGGNNTTLFLNRTSGSGSIMDFRLGGSQVGVIGVTSAELAIGGGDANLLFMPSDNAIAPSSTSSGGASDGVLDLGRSARRFKDLYLSGTANVGGVQVRATGNLEVGGYNGGTDYGLILTPADGSAWWHMYNDAGGHLAFGQGGTFGSTEKMRIDSSGSLLVGKTASGIANSGFEVGQSGQINVTQAGAVVARFNRKTSDGSILELTKDSTTVGSIGTHTSNMFIGSVDSGLYFDSTNNRISPYYVNNNSLPNGGISLGGNSNRFQDLYLSGTANVQYAGATDTGIYFNGSFNAVVPYRPDTGVAVDDYLDLGVYSHRWDDIFATNGTIQTSDRNEKQDIEDLTEAEERVAVAAKGLLKKFRWKSAVEDKGDDARIHFGIIAQDLQDAFEAEGLDAGRYGMFTSNTWTNEDGEEQTRMGVRYSELLAFIISAI